MKNLQFLFIAFVVVLFSCISPKQKQTEKVTSFIAGTYVRKFEGEYSKGHDTLIINQPVATNDFYIIQHNSSYQKSGKSNCSPLNIKLKPGVQFLMSKLTFCWNKKWESK